MGALRESKCLVRPNKQLSSRLSPAEHERKETYSSHLMPANMERLILFSPCRLDLDVVPWPAAVPRRSLFGPEPLPRELTLRIGVRKIGISVALERGKAWDAVT
jgi:hypothetical protein